MVLPLLVRFALSGNADLRTTRCVGAGDPSTIVIYGEGSDVTRTRTNNPSILPRFSK